MFVETALQTGDPIRTALALVAVALMLAAPVARADEEEKKEEAPSPWTLEASLSTVSSYMWRGYDFSARTPALQPYIEFDLKLPFLSEHSAIMLTAFTSTSIDRSPAIDDTQWGVLYHHTLPADFDLQIGHLLYISPAYDDVPTDIGGEFAVILSREFAPVTVSAMYARGWATFAGTAINVFAEMWVEPPVEGFTFGPYLQLDYTDQFGVAESEHAGFAEYMGGVEGGMQFEMKFGELAVRAAFSVITVPSSFVRRANADSELADNPDAGEALIRPWASVSVAYVKE